MVSAGSKFQTCQISKLKLFLKSLSVCLSKNYKGEIIGFIALESSGKKLISYTDTTVCLFSNMVFTSDE